jgi:hypothetical protein
LKKIIFGMILLFTSVFFVYGENQVSRIGSKVLIIPLVNESDTKQYANSHLIQSILFKSLYCFLGVLPSISVPDEKELKTIQWDSNRIGKIAEENKADFILFGDYHLSGKKTNPNAEIHVRIWSFSKKEMIFAKNYETSTDIELFDTVDKIIGEGAEGILNTKVDIASISFGSFKIGVEPHYIYLNNRLIAIATNGQFSLTLRVPAETKYTVVVSRLFNHSIEEQQSIAPKLLEEGFNFIKINPIILSYLQPVFSSELTLKAGENAGFSYESEGHVEIFPIRNRRWNKKYYAFLNQVLVSQESNELTLPGGVFYEYKLLDNFSNKIFQKNFFLASDIGKKYRDSHMVFLPKQKNILVPKEKGILCDDSSYQFSLDLLFGRSFTRSGSFSGGGIQGKAFFYVSPVYGSWNPIGFGIEFIRLGEGSYSYLTFFTNYDIKPAYTSLRLIGQLYFFDIETMAIRGEAAVGFEGIESIMAVNSNTSITNREFRLFFSPGLGCLFQITSELKLDASLNLNILQDNYHVNEQFQAANFDQASFWPKIDLAVLYQPFGPFLLELGAKYWMLPRGRITASVIDSGSPVNIMEPAHFLYFYLGLKLQFDTM